MKLEEVKEQLESLKESIKSSIEEPTDVEDVFVQDVQAIETVLQELEHLQKENEELKNERNGYRTQVNSAFDNGFIHKDKIREKKDYYYDRAFSNSYIKPIKKTQALAMWYALNDLLKEE